MRDRRQQLARIDRVRSIQLSLARAAEAEAKAHAASETALGLRIAELAAAIAPAPAAGGGFTLAAAAHYRERLQQSAQAAEARVTRAQDRAALATTAALAAERDSKAVEKLRDRAHAEAAYAERRALEAASAGRGGNRHDIC